MRRDNPLGFRPGVRGAQVEFDDIDGMRPPDSIGCLVQRARRARHKREIEPRSGQKFSELRTNSLSTSKDQGARAVAVNQR